MLKKISDYESLLQLYLKEGKSLSDFQMISIRTHIEFFQHERLVHELIMILFAILSVIGILFFVINPEFSIFFLCILFMGLLIPYIKHYYGLENGVQRLYELYDDLEKCREVGV